MCRLPLKIRGEAGAFQPIVEAVNVVARWFSLTKHEDVNEAERQRHRRQNQRSENAHFQCAEAQQQNHHEGEPAADNEPEQFALQPPRAAFGIVGTVRFRESDSVFHWKVPTSMVELPMPKAVNNAFTMTGAPAMMRPPIMESFPVSASPRRMANPPPNDTDGSEDESDEHHDAQRR